MEGPEGAGKTTQGRLLAEYLATRGYQVLHVREPGGTAIGERIRALLLDPRHLEMTAHAEMLLFAAARAQLVAEVIRPALARGAFVLCDRFVDASLAYQGMGRGLGLEIVRSVNAVATGGLSPDLTLLLDIDPAEGLRRRAAAGAAGAGGVSGVPGGGDRMEREGAAFHERVREGFLSLARNEPRRIRVIDARGPAAAVQEEIRRTVDGFLRGRRSGSGGEGGP